MCKIKQLTAEQLEYLEKIQHATKTRNGRFLSTLPQEILCAASDAQKAWNRHDANRGSFEQAAQADDALIDVILGKATK